MAHIFDLGEVARVFQKVLAVVTLELMYRCCVHNNNCAAGHAAPWEGRRALVHPSVDCIQLAAFKP